MKNPFKSDGFDSVIGPSTTLVGSADVYGTMVVDGKIVGTTITGKDGSVFVNGQVDAESIRLANLTVCGAVSVKDVYVTGTLSVKKGAALTAENIFYVNLVIDPGAEITGNLQKLEAGTTPQV